jgi:release factor glutamine methyltransferase
MGLALKEVINIGSKRLELAGCGTPKLDAEVLLSYYLKVERSFLFAHISESLDDMRAEAYFEIIDLRATGLPVQYITGRQEFMGISFMVNQDVLIPRPDTETLVQEVIQIVKETYKKQGTVEILDLCCGSGAICVSLAYYISKAKLAASDISQKALVVARKNAEDYNLTGRIRFLQGDLFAPIKTGAFNKGRFDIIVSNPPYIKSDIIPTLQREIFDHEPLIALDGGEEGLDFYRRIVTEAPNYLKKKGLLVLEIGYDQGEALCNLFTQDERYEDVEILQDLAGHDRVVKARLVDGSKKKIVKDNKK